MGYIWLSCWSRKSCKVSYTAQGDAKRESPSENSQYCGDGGIAKDSCTQLTECTEAELVQVWSLHPYILVCLEHEDTLRATERNAWTATQPPNPPPIIFLACKVCWGNGGPELVAVAKMDELYRNQAGGREVEAQPWGMRCLE